MASKQAYQITKTAATGGTFTVTLDGQEVTKAEKDSAVLITPTPANGYEVDKISVYKTATRAP